MTIDYDESGKLDLSTIYNRPDPTRYFSMLGRLDYCIPEEAKPAFQQIIAARRAATGVSHTRVVDVGCSYGVNAALLKFDLSMDDLNAHYEKLDGLTRDEILSRDIEFYGSPVDEALEGLNRLIATSQSDWDTSDTARRLGLETRKTVEEILREKAALPPIR